MKRIVFIAVAIAAMASCTKNQQPIAVVTDDGEAPVGFSVYSGTAATKGVSVAKEDVIAADKGIGVFAFYQPATNGASNNFNSRKYATPDFMYNANVKPVDPAATPLVWAYNPVKYWPNNTGDQVSFFAYAPYKADTTWEDLGFSTDVNATKMTASFPIYNEKAAMQDYLFATPALNKSKQHVSANAGDPTADLITFNFKHIMSRIAINIGAIVDKMNTNAPEAWTDPNTVISVESIEFKGIAESYDWTYTIASSTSAWKENGEQDFLLTAKAGDFQNNTSASWTAAGFNTLLSEEDSKPGYLFIAPQNLTDAKMVITYKVATTDPSSAANSSTITNVIEKEIGVNFESGKAYTLNLLIGMKTVELSAEVTDWVDASSPAQIDIPENI